MNNKLPRVETCRYSWCGEVRGTNAGGFCPRHWSYLDHDQRKCIEDQNGVKTTEAVTPEPPRSITYTIPAQGGFLSRLAWSLWTAAITLAGWVLIVHFFRIK